MPTALMLVRQPSARMRECPGGSSPTYCDGSLCTPRHTAPPNAEEGEGGPEQHEAGRFRDIERSEQPVLLAVDPIGEVERIGGAGVTRAGPEAERPKAAGRVEASDVDRDRAEKGAGARIEGVDLAIDEAEIAHQQIVAELGEIPRGQGDAPRRCELAAGDQSLQKIAVLIEDVHNTHSRRRTRLSRVSGRRVG